MLFFDLIHVYGGLLMITNKIEKIIIEKKIGKG